MKTVRSIFDPFVLIALLVLGVTAYTFFTLYFQRQFPVFTTEEEIQAAVQTEFPFFAEYL